MSLSVEPIITESCMACTIPFSNSTSYEKVEPYQKCTINYKKRYEKVVVYAVKSKSISSNRLYNMNNNMKKSVSKYRPMKISRKNRKIHNIHQPGRTNCSQRYQRYQK